MCKKPKMRNGRWLDTEHELFKIAIKKFGISWISISTFVKTRTTIQCRTHYQKFIQKPKWMDMSTIKTNNHPKKQSLIIKNNKINQLINLIIDKSNKPSNNNIEYFDITYLRWFASIVDKSPHI